VTPLSTLLDAAAGPSAADAFQVLDDEHRLTPILTELEAGRAFKQPEKHYYDVLGHNLATVRALESALGDSDEAAELRGVLSWLDTEEWLGRQVGGIPLLTLLKLAALVHDIAKPATATIIDGALRFPRHGPRGAELLAERLPSIGFPPAATGFVCRMVRQHLRSNELVRNWPPTDHAIRRFTADVDGHALPLMLINLSDGWATRGPGYSRQNFRIHVGLVNYVVARCWAVSQPGEQPLVTGEELMTTMDLEGGRLLGRVLTSVRQAQLAGQVRDHESALALAREVLATLRAEVAHASV
jgi:hypothetical protein